MENHVSQITRWKSYIFQKIMTEFKAASILCGLKHQWGLDTVECLLNSTSIHGYNKNVCKVYDPILQYHAICTLVETNQKNGGYLSLLAPTWNIVCTPKGILVRNPSLTMFHDTTEFFNIPECRYYLFEAMEQQVLITARILKFSSISVHESLGYQSMDESDEDGDVVEKYTQE